MDNQLGKRDHIIHLLSLQLWLLLINWLVQTSKLKTINFDIKSNFVYHNLEFTLIYLLLSYPLGSLDIDKD